MEIKQAKFITSVASVDAIPNYEVPEIAIAGKSNVGKSSFINMMTNQSKLAKTSAEPGRTRLLNYFEINKGKFYFVDLPGYGFAKVTKTEKEKWGNLLETYLTTSENLINVFVLVDSRHEPTDDDKMLINYLYSYQIPFSIIATKADKLSKQQQQKSLQMLSSSLAVGKSNIILTSSLTRVGKVDVLNKIEILLQNATDLMGKPLDNEDIDQ